MYRDLWRVEREMWEKMTIVAVYRDDDVCSQAERLYLGLGVERGGRRLVGKV